MKLGYVLILFCLLTSNLQPIETVSAQTVPNLSFQADIYGNTNLESIEYPSTLAFTNWGGFGVNAHTYRSRLAGGDQVAYAISASRPNAFSLDVITQAGDPLTLSLASADYPKGSVEAISPNELHFVWDINQLGLHVKLHRYVKLFRDDRVTVKNIVQEKYEIENVGPNITVVSFSEYLHIDDATEMRDYNNDGKPETLLAINSFTTIGYPRFGKIYLAQVGFNTEFSLSGNHAIVKQSLFVPLANLGDRHNLTVAIFVSGLEKQRDTAETELARDAATLLDSVNVPAHCFDVDNNGNADNDYDGLCDNWETAGIDFNGDNSVDLMLYDVNGDGTIQDTERADANHKDIYIEVDWMEQHRPSQVALDRVINSFANAPVDCQPGEPSNCKGIRLHIQVDEEAVSHNDHLAFEPHCTGPATGDIQDFDNIKEQRFGNAIERVHDNSVNILDAKRLVFHYVIFAHNLLGKDGVSGCAELPGNDFVVSLGSFGSVGGHNTGYVDHQAGTFMHELGHNLNLRHGGADNYNCKPNYLSVMSYTRQFNGHYVFGRPLDYSNRKLITLHESSLNEVAGIGGTGGDRTAFGPSTLLTEIQVNVDASGSIDWDLDGEAADNSISRDINNLSPNCPGEGSDLESYNDWANLQFNFRNSTDFADGVHLSMVQVEEFNIFEAELTSPDTDNDSVVNVRDNCPAVPNPNQTDSNQDGIGDACEEGTTVTFDDVPSNYWARSFIERLYQAGITGGCAMNPLQYCPEAAVTRAQMAVFLLRGIHGSAYNPPAVGASTGFGDVPTTYWAAAWIKQLAAEGITGGCGIGTYCPEAPVTRAQMAVFLLRSKHGASYTPPAVGSSTGFNDVPPGYWAAAWIKQLVAEGITTGCGAGTYCPEAPVTRAQMAVFLVRTFALP
jgi:hypothetical protein